MGKTTVLIDGHVHLYPVYDLINAVEKGTQNLLIHASRHLKQNSNVLTAWLLAERSDSNVFDQIYYATKKFSHDTIKFKKERDPLTIKVEKNGEPMLYIFAGRQLVTQEGLEVLSLISNLNIPDHHKTMDELIQAVKDSGGIPALNWAPGKWFFERGKVIARQIEAKSPGDFLIGETTLRPSLWPEPKLIKHARKKGFRIETGSDPLPFRGEETAIGSYGFLIEGIFDPDNPAQSVRNLIQDPRNEIKIIGKRNDVITFARRQYKIMMEKRTRS